MVAVEQVDAATLRLCKRLRGNKWWAIDLRALTVFPGSYALPILSTSLVVSRASGRDVTVGTVLPSNLYSAYEYATNCQPTGASQLEWVGNVHGYENPISLTTYVDDVEVTPGARVEGSSARVVRVSEQYHPYLNAGATKIADVTTTYTMSSSGLRVEWTRTTAVEMVIRQDYAAMLPAAEALSVGVIDGLAGTIDLTAGTGGAAESKRAPALYAAVYTPSNSLRTSLTVAASSVEEWARSGESDGQTFIEDRAGNAMNKAYVTRVSPTNQYTAAAASEISGDVLYDVSVCPLSSISSLVAAGVV